MMPAIISGEFYNPVDVVADSNDCIFAQRQQCHPQTYRGGFGPLFDVSDDPAKRRCRESRKDAIRRSLTGKTVTACLHRNVEFGCDVITQGDGGMLAVDPEIVLQVIRENRQLMA